MSPEQTRLTITTLQVQTELLTPLDFCKNIDECDEKLAEKLERFNDEVTSLLPFRERIKRLLDYLNAKLWLCIILISFFSCMLGITLDVVSGLCFNSE